MNTISESALINGDIKTTLFWVRCIDANALRQAFAPFNISASTDQDLNELANDSISGKDVSGANRGTDGNPIVFNVKEIVGNIKLTSDKFNSPTCNVQYAQ